MTDKPAEQAYHARGAGREERKFEEVLELHVNSSESMRETYRRTANSDMENFQEGFTEGVRRAIEVYGNWRIAREPGADTGTTPRENHTWNEALNAASLACFHAQDHCDKPNVACHMIDRQAIHKLKREGAAAERGTTPPEGLRELEDALDARDVLSSLLTSFLVRLNCADKVRDLTEAEYEIREKVRDALNDAATQRAPVEQGRSPKIGDILGDLTRFLHNMRSDARESQDVTLENYVEAIEQFVKRMEIARRAPDHAREGALRATLEKILENGYHNDTCGAVLSDNTSYPCSCWKSKVRAALGEKP